MSLAFGYQGKKALVFGGTKGIGWATTKSLASKGCDVVCMSRSLPTEELPSNVTHETCDVLNREDVADVCKKHACVALRMWQLISRLHGHLIVSTVA